MLINFTTEAFKEKPQKYNNLKFVEKDVTIKDMAIMVHDGHGFTSLYNVKNLVTSTKNQKNWKESQFIGYDIDKVNISMNDLYDKLNVKPSICYTTPSNEKEDGKYCYRLIYVLDKPINDIERFKFYYISFSQYLGISDLIDKKAKDCTRYFNGSYQCDLIINEDSIIDLTKYNLDKCCKNESINNIIENNEVSEMDIPLLYNKNNKEERGNIIVGCPKQTNPLCWIDYNKEIVDDFFNLDYKVFVYNYNCYDSFVNYEETPIELDDDEPFGYYPKDFRKIVRKPKYVTKNGKRQKQDVKLHDGEGRRRKLAINMIIRRLIYPNITFENLLYNMAYEISNYIDNSDGQLTKKIAFGICLKVMKYDLNDFYRNGFGIHEKANKMFINEEFCAKYNISKTKVRNMINASKLNMDSVIEKYYVSGMSASELYKIMKENKETISSKTCSRYVNKKEEVKKITDEDIIKVIDKTKSYRNNVRLVSERLGIEIGKDKVAKLLKEKEKRAMKKNFESDEEMMNFQLEMMKNKREREEGEKMLKEVTGSVPEPSEPLSSIDPTTIKDEEKEEPREENNEGKTLIHNKHYQELFDNIKPSMTWHEKDAMKSKIQMYLYFGRITKDEAQELIELLNRAKVYTVSCSCC